MRIAIVHYTAPPVIGGVERIVGEQARALSARGHQVDVVCGRCDEVMPRLQDAAAGYEAVIVHNVFTMPFDLKLTAALREMAESQAGVRFINWVHDIAAVNPNYSHLSWDAQDMALLKNPPRALHVAVSEVRRFEYLALTRLAEDQCRIIPNGVDVAGILALTDRVNALVANLRLWDRDYVLLHPARVLRRKNIELGLRVVRALMDLGLDVAYLVTGAPDAHQAEGAAYGAELLALIQELSLEDSAVFLGDTLTLTNEDVRSLYAVADALLFPSKAEGFGLPVVEAGLHGVPVFCSDIPAHREVGQCIASYFDLDDDPALIAHGITTHPVVESRYVRRMTLAGWLDWPRICVAYIEPLLNGAPPPP
ncbi:MAG: glycosyltransferase [Verrucomicrobiaceae bacterium]|nr:glycosyltransferase [Verrucomicrobiaceae bacterium]